MIRASAKVFALGRATLQALAVIGFFALWEIGVTAGWISAFLVGSPFGIFAVGYKMIASGELLSDTWFTLFEAILGFVIGTIVGSLIMALLSNGCNLLGISPFLQQVIIGCVIVLAVTFDEFQRRRMA